MAEFYKAANVNEVPSGTKKLIEIDFVPVLLFNVDGEYFAMEDVCTHDGGPLGEGFLDGEEIECPRHGAKFCIKTGKALCMPAVEDIECFPVKIEDNEIYVCID